MAPKTGSLRILGRTGDEPVRWTVDLDVPETEWTVDQVAQVAEARKQFAALVGGGYTPLHRENRVLDELDLTIGEIIMAPRTGGG